MDDTLKPARISYETSQGAFQCQGDWSIHTINALKEQIALLKSPRDQKITLTGHGITKFDSAGALELFNFIEKLKEKKNTISLEQFNEHHQNLLSMVAEKKGTLNYKPTPPDKKSWVYRLGQETMHKLNQGNGLIILIGDLTDKLYQALKHPRRFHLSSVVATIYSTGVTALPIIALLSFLIGVVLAYEMGLQLEPYGANIFIAFLSGMAIFREFSPLITAIIVAGRTSSSFTAQIGSMKINEEIDALNTMGLSPTELLVVPKVLGLMIVFPLLIFWSVIFGTLGAMIMSKYMLHVGYIDYLTRLQSSVGIKQLLLGLYKAPAYSLLIALVGCFQGFRVQASADSVGAQTTKSVVQALFLIIIADSLYAIIYSWIGI